MPQKIRVLRDREKLRTQLDHLFDQEVDWPKTASSTSGEWSFTTQRTKVRDILAIGKTKNKSAREYADILLEPFLAQVSLLRTWQEQLLKELATEYPHRDFSKVTQYLGGYPKKEYLEGVASGDITLPSDPSRDGKKRSQESYKFAAQMQLFRLPPRIDAMKTAAEECAVDERSKSLLLKLYGSEKALTEIIQDIDVLHDFVHTVDLVDSSFKKGSKDFVLNRNINNVAKEFERVGQVANNLSRRAFELVPASQHAEVIRGACEIAYNNISSLHINLGKIFSSTSMQSNLGKL